MSIAILFHIVSSQHVSDINISIVRSLRLFCWITTLVVLFLVRCVFEFRCGWVVVVSVFRAEACNTDNTPNQPHRNSNTLLTNSNTSNAVARCASYDAHLATAPQHIPTQHDMLPQHFVCKYELNCEYCNINLARNKAPWWWSNQVETCRSVLKCLKVFYVKLYVH